MKPFNLAKMTIGLLCLTVLTGLLFASAQEQKAINVRPNAGNLEVKIKATKPVYKVGEPIKFEVEGNAKFYLYIFNINAEEEKAVMLFPNKYEKGNHFRADKEYTIPGDKVKFMGDSSGKEEIVAIASPEELDIDLGKFKSAGQFYVIGIEEYDEIKALCVRRSDPEDKPVIEEITLIIIER